LVLIEIDDHTLCPGKRYENVFRNILYIFKFHRVVYRHYSGEVENVYIFCSKFIQETVYQISLESPEILRKTIWSIFSGHCTWLSR